MKQAAAQERWCMSIKLSPFTKNIESTFNIIFRGQYFQRFLKYYIYLPYLIMFLCKLFNVQNVLNELKYLMFTSIFNKIVKFNFYFILHCILG